MEGGRGTGKIRAVVSNHDHIGVTSARHMSHILASFGRKSFRLRRSASCGVARGSSLLCLLSLPLPRLVAFLCLFVSCRVVAQFHPAPANRRSEGRSGQRFGLPLGQSRPEGRVPSSAEKSTCTSSTSSHSTRQAHEADDAMRGGPREEWPMLVMQQNTTAVPSIHSCRDSLGRNRLAQQPGFAPCLC